VDEQTPGSPVNPPDRWIDAERPHNLAEPLTSFIGRDHEIAEVERLLESTRLLTLTGTGGVGKTRLGREVAVRLLARPMLAGLAYPDGVWLVQLAALTNPALVARAVAAALHVSEEPERPVTASLVSALRTRQLLLVLDNCEHLGEPCARLADALLRTCPGLQILATSRQPLGVAGEMTFWVPSLALPEPTPNRCLASAGDPGARPEPGAPATEPRNALAEAVQLFVERARAAVPAFTLTDRNIEDIERICCRLDGIPLAIELAAARIAVVGPAQIAARLDDRYRFLTGGSRTALPRYRTLRALIDWSHDLLDEGERVLFRRLAVFAGGWTLEAAEAVCGGDGLAPEEVLDILSGLATKSLVLTATDRPTCEHDHAVRFRFLESLRAYAVEKLRESGEEATLRQRHRDWLLGLAERVEPELHGPRSVWWMDRLEGERENVRAALTWCVERGEAEAGLRLVSALSRFWQIRGPYRETRDVLSDLLALPSAGQRTVAVQTARMQALLTAGVLAMRQDDRDAADAYFQESLEISRLLGDQRGLAMARISTARIAHVRGDHLAASQQQAEAIRVLEALGDDFWLAKAHHHVGVAAYVQDNLVTARAQYEACLAIFERLGDKLGILTALEQLGEVALAQDELDTARSLLRTSLTMAHRLDDKDRVAMTLAALAGLAAAQRRPGRAVRLAAAATALVEATDQRNSPAWYARVERWLQPARRTLTADACAAEEAAGRAMSLDATVADALEDVLPIADDRSPAAAVLVVAPREEPSRSRSRLAPVTSALSPREAEVASLIAQGMTNRQIAETLIITEGTAANHVKHILARLALDSRVQVAAWAIEHGLYRRAAS
jgi:predicted ATPase/DNA-binding CsgD family transcriptional regulator